MIFGKKNDFLADIVTDKIMIREFNRTFYTQEFNSDSVSFHIKKWEKTLQIVRMIFLTIYAISNLLFNHQTKNIRQRPECLVFGLPEDLIQANSNTKEISSFFSNTIMEIAQEKPSNFLIQSRKPRIFKSTGNTKVVRHIGTHLLLYSERNRIRLVWEIIKNFSLWLRYSFYQSEILLIGPEFIIDSLALSETIINEIKFLITTQSTMLCLPTAFRVSKNTMNLMFWYSDNSTQIWKKDSESKRTYDYSYLEIDSIHIHFVWTNSWADIMRKYTNGEVRVIGPIIFKTVEEKLNNVIKKTKIKKILVFDVTPKKFLNNSSSFYEFNNLKKFINDIITSTNFVDKNIKIDLKPKRNYTKADNKDYIAFLKEHSSEINLLEANQDLLKLISNYDLVISIPFTSPSIICKRLGIETFFYSGSFDYDLPSEYEGIKVIIGEESLKKHLVDIRSNF